MKGVWNQLQDRLFDVFQKIYWPWMITEQLDEMQVVFVFIFLQPHVWFLDDKYRRIVKGLSY